MGAAPSKHPSHPHSQHHHSHHHSQSGAYPTAYNTSQHGHGGDGPVYPYPSTFGIPAFATSKKKKKDKGKDKGRKASGGGGKHGNGQFPGGFVPTLTGQANPQHGVPIPTPQIPITVPPIPPIPTPAPAPSPSQAPVIPGVPPPHPPASAAGMHAHHSVQGTPAPNVPRFTTPMPGPRAGSAVPSSSGHGHAYGQGYPTGTGARRAPTPFIRVQPTPVMHGHNEMDTPSTVEVTPVHYDIYPPAMGGQHPPPHPHSHSQHGGSQHGHQQHPQHAQYPHHPQHGGGEPYRHQGGGGGAPVIPGTMTDRPPSPPNPDIFARTRPPTPPQSAHVYGPPPDLLNNDSEAIARELGFNGEPPEGGERTMRPLPAPPRDLYEFTPYKNLLSLPETTALIEERKKRREGHPHALPEIISRSTNPPNPGHATAASGPNTGPSSSHGHAEVTGPPGTVAAFSVSRPAGGGKKGMGGLFRGLSSRKKKKDMVETRYIYVNNPVSVPVSGNPEGMGIGGASDAGGMGGGGGGIVLTRSASVHSSHPHPHPQAHSHQSHHSHHRARSVGHSQSGHSQAGGHPEPWYDTHKIRISHTTPYYSSFLNHSPHRVMYRNAIYPTATHLFEALKFIDTAPERAEVLRNTDSVEGVFQLSEGWVRDYGLEGAGVRADWGSVFLGKMEEVLMLKFQQSPAMRSLLLNTGNAQLIYSDPTDTYWGDGVGPRPRRRRRKHRSGLGLLDRQSQGHGGGSSTESSEDDTDGGSSDGEDGDAHLRGSNELGRALMRVRERLRNAHGNGVDGGRMRGSVLATAPSGSAR